MNYTDPQQVPAIWQIGDVILDKYEIKQVFQGGGMGLVYRVYHRDWNLDMAVKAPRPEFFATEEQIECFEREAENWVSLGLHPNVASCFYVRRLGAVPRIFAEFVDSGSLSEWIRTKKLYEGSKEAATTRILDIAIQFARGLHHAHQKGLIHQDVKPGNVLMTRSGVAKVSDFGLARARPKAAISSRAQSIQGQTVSVAGSGFLTPEYASPEQANGLPLSRRTDVWSWAVSMLEMLKGEVDWTHGQAAPYVLEDFYGDAAASDPLAQLLQECLARDPQERPADFHCIVESLKQIYQTASGQQYPRAEPEAAIQSSDVLNNYAVSLLDLDRLFADSASGRRGAYEYLAELEGKDRTHVDGMLNRILMRWRHLHAPINEINRAIDNVLAMPGVPEEVGKDWLIAYEWETMQYSRYEGHRSSSAMIYKQVKDKLRMFFYGLSNVFCEAAQRLLREEADVEDGQISASKAHSGLVCWVGTTDDDTGRGSVVCVWHTMDEREVFRLNDKPLCIHAAALSESGAALVVMFVEERISGGSNGDEYRFHLAIYDMTGRRKEWTLPSMEIPVGTIRLTVNDAGTAASVWIEPSRYNGWYQIAYNRDVSTGEFHRAFDLRVAAPIISSELICASGDGERLLIAQDNRIQLWETSGASLRKCLLELSLANFGLIDIRGHLPGFDLDNGFEFTIDQWNIFDVLGALRQLPASRRVPYRIARPQNADQIHDEQEQLKHWKVQCSVFEHQGEAKAAIDVLDKCLSLRSAAKADLLEHRHSIVRTAQNRYVSQCWHNRHIDQYWDSNIMALESGAEGEMTLKRFRSIDHVESCTGRQRAIKWDAFEVLERDDVAPYGFAALSESAAIFILACTTGHFEKSVALLQREEAWSGKVVWELPLPQGHREQMYEHIVLAGKTLFRRDVSGGIVAHDVATGKDKGHLAIRDSVSVMRQVVWHDRNCLAVGTKTSGEIIIFDEDTAVLFEGRVNTGSAARIEDISRGAEAVVFAAHGDDLWHLHLQSGVKTCLWRRWEHQCEQWERPHLQRLSPCGRALAYVFGMRFIIFDVFTRRVVLNWKIPPRELVPPCFDLSGRWLTLAHSANKQEVFELLWDIA